MKKNIFLIVFAFFNFMSTAQTALDFNPDDGEQQVQIPDITCPAEFTFEAWIFFRERNGTFNTIFEFANDRPYIGIIDTDEPRFSLYLAAQDPDPIPDNQWVHVAASYSSTTQQAKIYVNGQLKATEENISILLDGVGAGIGFNESDTVFDGQIDEIRLWEVVRTDAEIAANWTGCLEGDEPGLYAYYTFNDGEGSVELDELTENDFDGVLVNMDPATDWVDRDFCNTLSVNDFDYNNLISIAPNPASDKLMVHGINEDTGYIIYNLLGSEVASGTISHRQEIVVDELNIGFYILSFENSVSIKFLKK